MSDQSFSARCAIAREVAWYGSCAPWLWPFDWFLRPWAYFRNAYVANIWLMYYAFWIGGASYVCGAYGSMAPEIYHSWKWMNNFKDKYDWLVIFTFTFGNIVWTIGMAGGIWESGNAMSRDDFYTKKLMAWKKAGSDPATKPKFNWIHFNWRNPRFFGAWLYFFGCLIYTIACIVLIDFDWHGPLLDYEDPDLPYLDDHVVTYAVLEKGYYIMNICGGILFFIAAPFYIQSWIDPILIGGIIPFRLRDITSVKWWAWFIFFWAGAAFFTSGVANWWTVMGTDRATTFTFKEFQNMTALTTGLGSLFYFFGSMCALCWTTTYLFEQEKELLDHFKNPSSHGTVYLEHGDSKDPKAEEVVAHKV